MASSTYIQEMITSRFENKTKKQFHPGSVIDLYNCAIAGVLEKVYEEIDNNKTPHIFTGLKGEQLDNTGIWVNLPRQVGESDESYLYRLKNWTLTNEASNTTAISDSLLLTQYAANIEFVPFTKGSGTATCYVLPKNYETETIANALLEAKEKISHKSSPTQYIEFIVPQIRKTVFEVLMKTKGDEALIKSNITFKVLNYVNSLPPKAYLHIGDINRIGINEPGVEYFSVLSTFINDIENKDIQILQEIDSKFIFDRIVWLGGD